MNLNEIEQALRDMKPRSKLYEIVKKEIKKRGHWKNKPRGNPMQKGQDPRRNM